MSQLWLSPYVRHYTRNTPEMIASVMIYGLLPRSPKVYQQEGVPWLPKWNTHDTVEVVRRLKYVEYH